YDHPFQWGSRRIGPDLAREGGQRSNLWHVVHFRNPALMTNGSIMPAYPWLETKELNFKTIPDRVWAASFLGAPYTRALDDSIAMAKEQAKAIADDIEKQKGPSGLEDKQVVALIAYLQRLGTDIYKTPAATDKTETAKSEPNSAGTTQK
ncbi:MAG: cbb3-type cytochrome c oxidase subunit II, partial [Planctomycetaceae bacterium]|nr:cbb3-type cytochrome c oxidase subunit II [Planctomycetaceae bacterium]